MFKNEQNQKITSRYIDPTGEFGERELQAATWYVKNKYLLRKIGMSSLVVFCVVIILINIIAWGNYLLFGMSQDQKMLTTQVIEFPNYVALHEIYKATPLNVDSTKVFGTVSNRYEFYTPVYNNNERWIAGVTYKYGYDNTQTEEKTSIVFPLSTGVLSDLNVQTERFGGSVDLQILSVEWRRINPHVIADVRTFLKDRDQFGFENFEYFRAGSLRGLETDRIKFDIYNDSAYSYWEPVFYLEYLNNGNVVGIGYMQVEKFLSGETRNVDIRVTSSNYEIDDVRLIPVINFFDQSQYMKPGEI